MDAELFYMLWDTALHENNHDIYMSNWLVPNNWGNPDEERMHDISDTLETVWKVAHMSFRDIYLASGLSQAKLARRLCMPLRTVENWCSGNESKNGERSKSARTPTDYERLWVAQILGLIGGPCNDV